MARRRRTIEASSDLRGPDLGDTAEPPAQHPRSPERLDVWAWQFCNRWVFLRTQRAAALRELYRLLDEARENPRSAG